MSEGPTLNRYRVDGITPKLVVFPENIKQISDILKLASDLRVSVIPSGNGSKLSFGNPPRGVDLVLSLCKLNRIIEYEPADLTVTVEAGMIFSDFQNVLAKEGQFLALDPPYCKDCKGDRPVAPTATIGGIIATNSSGPLRLRYGIPRDMVIGLKVVLSDGTIAKSGGKVVKNVAGYDLNKLFIGSLGTLGVIAELSFKLHPLPKQQSSVLITFKTLPEAIGFAFDVLDSSLLPSFLELISVDPEAQTLAELQSLIEVEELVELRANRLALITLIIGVDGHVETSNGQIDQLQKLSERFKSSRLKILSGAEDQRLREILRSFAEWQPNSSDIICKASVLISEVESIFEEAYNNININILSHIGNGIVLIRFATNSNNSSSDSDQELSRLSKTISKLRGKCVQKGGNLIIEAAPPQLKSMLDVWGAPKSDFRVMKGIKSELDPHSVLSPGRFLGGI